MSPLLTVTSDYRAALNATIYMATVAADTPLGSPVLTFKLYIDNTYFGSPQAVIFHLMRNGSFEPVFAFDNGEETDTMVFSDFNNSLPVIEISRSILYFDTTTAGRYEYTLSVTVVARKGSGVTSLQETLISPVQVTVTGM